jgi:hypothetical protein
MALLAKPLGLRIAFIAVFEAWFFLLVGQSAGGQLAGKEGQDVRIAILIGIEDYKPPAARLPFVRNDLDQLERVLKSFGYQVQKLEDGKASKRAIESEVADRLRRSDERSVVVIYFSGHAERDSRGELYFLPADFQGRVSASTAVSLNWVREQLEKSRAKLKLLILDTCHAGASGASPAGIAVQAVFRDVPGLYVLASCRSEEKSYVWQLKRQSLFTYWLIRAMRGQADGVGAGGKADGKITPDELFYYTSFHVPMVAQELFPAGQTPDRVVGPGVPVDAYVTQVDAASLTEVLDELAEYVATTLQVHGKKAVAVLDFQIDPQCVGTLPTLGPDFSRYCADRIEEWLTVKAAGQFEVISREAVQGWLREQRIGAGDILKVSLQELRAEPWQLEAVVAGTVEEWTPPHLRLRVRIRITDRPAVSAAVSLPALLGREQAPLLDYSGLMGTPCALADPGWPEGIGRPQLHPMLDPSWPYRVYVVVASQRRPGKVCGNKLYVSLRPGDVYQIEIEIAETLEKQLLGEGSGYLRADPSSSTGQIFQPALLVRVLVDGRSTRPERPRLRREGVAVKSVEPEERQFLPAQPVPLEEASPWLFSISGRTRRWIPGFAYEEVTGVDSSQGGSASQETKQGLGRVTLKYREFKVTELASISSEFWDYREELGVITVAFYGCHQISGRTRTVEVEPTRGGLVTGLGAAGEASTTAVFGVVPDPSPRAVVKIHYVDPDTWESLEGQVIDFEARK